MLGCRMRILLIEDDPTVARYLVRDLDGFGHQVDHFANGEDGLRAAKDGQFDVMVVDRMLPGMDGLTLIEAIRAAENQTPVLILSALGEVDDKVHGLKAGGDDYLVKPFGFPELLARIEALVRRAAIQEEAGWVLRFLSESGPQLSGFRKWLVKHRHHRRGGGGV